MKINVLCNKSYIKIFKKNLKKYIIRIITSQDKINLWINNLLFLYRLR